MSHYQERTEKNCLNCGTEVAGRFCQKCGQENIIARDSFWSLFTHFVYDITHFDSKFFSSLRLMLTKPGQISLEYVQGKRVSFLHPIRMYVFTSAFFFILFFTFYNISDIGRTDAEKEKAHLSRLELAKTSLEEHPMRSKDSLEARTARGVWADLKLEIDSMTTKMEREKLEDSLEDLERKQRRDSTRLAKGKKIEPEPNVDSGDIDIDIIPASKKNYNDPYSVFGYESIEAYQRMQNALPKEKRDGWIKRAFATKVIAVSEQGKLQDEREFLKAFLNNLFHSFPKMLFVSLPLFALFLSWLYGRKKHLYYSDHAIFTIHIYCATFLFLLGTFALSKLEEKTGWGIINLIQVIVTFCIYLYLYKGMRRFYGDSRRKTILKFILLNILSFFMMTILLVIFTAISAAQLASATH